MDRVAALNDPRSIGEALHGDLRDNWKYRAGDWRIRCAIVDRMLIVEVIEVAHRSTACQAHGTPWDPGAMASAGGAAPDRIDRSRGASCCAGC